MPMPRASLLRASLVSVAALALGGCAALRLVGLGGDDDGPQKPQDPVRVNSVSLAMSEQANEGWPARVELVRVRDETLAGVLLRIETPDWFGAGGDGFRRANPAALYHGWEVVPGTTIGPFKTRKRGRFAGILFCGTRPPSPPPLRLDRSGHLMIYVDKEGCNVTEREDDGKKWWKPW